MTQLKVAFTSLIHVKVCIAPHPQQCRFLRQLRDQKLWSHRLSEECSFVGLLKTAKKYHLLYLII